MGGDRGGGLVECFRAKVQWLPAEIGIWDLAFEAFQCLAWFGHCLMFALLFVNGMFELFPRLLLCWIS